MDHNYDFTDHDDTISIYKVTAHPRYPVNDPRHLPAEMRNRLAQTALAQIERRQAENLRMLVEVEKLTSATGASTD